MKLKTKVIKTGKTSAGLIIPDDFIEKLGGGKKPKVKVKFNDYEYRGSIAFMHGNFWLSVTNETREKSGVEIDEEIVVDILLDDAPREVTIQEDFQKALDENPEAESFFQTLSYRNKRWYTMPIEAAKKTETRERRIAKSIDMLKEGKKP